MKIVIVASLASSLVNFRGELIRFLLSKGHEVNAVAPEFDRRTKNTLTALGVNVHEIAFKRNRVTLLGDLQYFLKLKNIFKQLEPDVVLSYTVKPNIWGGIAAGQLGYPSIAMLTGLGYAFTGHAGFKQSVVKSIIKRLYSISTKYNSSVIFQNKDDRRDFIDEGCLANITKAFVVNGSGVNTNYYDVKPLPKNASFLMIARLLRSKGIVEYCNASIELSNAYPEINFSLAGYIEEGPDAIKKHELKSWIKQGINFLGKLEDVRPALSDCSIYVLPSYREGTPRTVLEAMALGRPIITCDTPGCRETTIHGLNGFLIKPADTDALKCTMEYFIKNNNCLNRFGAASRRIVVEKFSVDLVNEQIYNVIIRTSDKN